MFRYVFKKKRPAIMKVRSGDSQEILARIERYLHENVDEPVQILTRFWDDQKKAITYGEIRQLVLTGTIDSNMIAELMQHYSVLVNDSMKTLWEKAIMAGSCGQPMLDDKHFHFNLETPGVKRWITERGSQFVTMATEEQRKALSALLLHGIDNNYGIDEIARNMRACIGLTRMQATAMGNYYNHMKKTLREEFPNMKESTILERAKNGALRYAERAHRQRALNIARTEMAYAYNQGADLSMRQARAKNLVGVYKKVWSTSGDEGVCSYCAALDGQEVGMDGKFDFGRGLFQGGEELPPAHPNCACAIEYVEVEPPRLNELTVEDVTQEYLDTASPYKGDFKIENEELAKQRSEEIDVAEWIYKTFGGDIMFLDETNNSSPDYKWRGRLWDLKMPEKENSITKRIQKGLSQIFSNPGGIIVDIRKIDISTERLEQIIYGRMKTSMKFTTDVMIINTEELIKILRYKK